MTRARWIAAIGATVVLVLGIAAGALLSIDPMSFAGGRPVALAAYRGPSPAGAPAELRGADLVTRGRYLATAADCQVCHTAPGGAPFAGGLALNTPFGVIFSPNITPDRATGIGGWSDDDFIRAVRVGRTPNGERLYPAMPYDSYRLMADQDVGAIKAYLFTLAPVRNAAPPTRLRFPFNHRGLLAIWTALYSPDRHFQPHADQSAQWNRGAYLVEALAHCGDCHTPRNLLQAPDNRQKFAGAVTQGWWAYNITADRNAGVGAWSDAELAAYLHDGHVLGRGAAAGPMADAVDASFSALTPADTQAIVAYLRTVPALGSPNLPAPKTQPASEWPKDMAGGDPRGRRVFEGACASCHGWSGVSPLTEFATLTGARAVNDPTAINVAQVVISGARRETPAGAIVMPAFGKAYSDEEIAAVANYVTARFGARAAAITPKQVAALR